MLLFLSQVHAAATANTSALKTISTCTTTVGGGCPKATANPIVAQPNGEILPPDPTLLAYIGSLYEGEVGGILMSVTLGGEDLSGMLLFALDDSGGPAPATWLGFGSTTHDWNGDGTADTSVGQVNWENRGQVSTTIAYMSGTGGEFSPTHDVSLAVTMMQGGSGVAPLNAWVVESMGVWDHATGEAFYQSDAATAASVALEISGFLYSNTFRSASTAITATEQAVWSVEDEALVVTGKAQLTARSSIADQTLLTMSDGRAYSESWSADANSSNFRRSLSASAGGTQLLSTADTGSMRRVVSDIIEVDTGEVNLGREVLAAEDLTMTSFPYSVFPASNWDRVGAALGGSSD